MTSERTFILLKPDAVGRGLNFDITERFEKRGFALVACRMMQADRAQAQAHCAGLTGAAKEEAVEFLTSGPVVASAWEAPGAIASALAMGGPARSGHAQTPA